MRRHVPGSSWLVVALICWLAGLTGLATNQESDQIRCNGEATVVLEYPLQPLLEKRWSAGSLEAGGALTGRLDAIHDSVG